MPAPVSQERCDRAKLLATVHSSRTVSALTGISRSVLFRLKKRGWKAAETTHPFRPRPTDFAIQNRHMGIDKLSKHYRTSTRVIGRWRRELQA